MSILYIIFFFFFFNDTATTEIYTLSLHDALPIFLAGGDHAAASAPFVSEKRREGERRAGGLQEGPALNHGEDRQRLPGGGPYRGDCDRHDAQRRPGLKEHVGDQGHADADRDENREKREEPSFPSPVFRERTPFDRDSCHAFTSIEIREVEAVFHVVSRATNR